MIYDIQVDGRLHRVKLDRSENSYQCELDGRTFEIDAALIGRDFLSVRMGGKSYRVRREQLAGANFVWVGTERFAVDVSDPRSLRGKRSLRGPSDGPISLVAPMPGKIVRVLVSENTSIEAGQGIVVVEAMKMQNEVKSPKSGRVRKMAAKEGASVNAGDVLATVE
jgi:biotin carboxyl carrier protein